METLRINKIENIFRHLEQDTIDAEGIKMVIPSPEAYKCLENFLLQIDDSLFSLLNDESAERLPGGTLVVNWRNGNNKIVLGVLIGKNFANFFYSPKKGTSVLAETKSVKELLSNKDFLSATQNLLEKRREKSAILI